MLRFTHSLLAVLTLTSFVACNSKDSSAPKSKPKSYAGEVFEDSPNPYPVTDQKRTADVDQLVKIRKTLKILEGELIAPAQEDLDQFADFLSHTDTGLVRLFPRGGENERRPLLVSGEGAYYQFKARRHDYGQGSDIEFDNYGSPQFAVGFAGVDFGFFGEVGKADIRNVDLGQPAVAYALRYISPDNQPEAIWRNEQYKWQAGVKDSGSGVFFSDRVPATVGTTYVVRSISEGRYDVAVVFQVVRRDATDDSLILAWRILKEFNQPHVSQ